MSKELREKVFGIMQSVYNAGARGEGISSEKGDELITMILDEVKEAVADIQSMSYDKRGFLIGKLEAIKAIDNLRGGR